MSFKGAMKTFFNDIIKGEFVLKDISRYLGHVVFIFAVVWCCIYVSLKIENTFIEMEANKAEIESLRVQHTDKTCALATFARRSTVERMLEESGSPLKAPEKPAIYIRK